MFKGIRRGYTLVNEFTTCRFVALGGPDATRAPLACSAYGRPSPAECFPPVYVEPDPTLGLEGMRYPRGSGDFVLGVTETGGTRADHVPAADRRSLRL